MLAATTSQLAFAALTREICPAWSAPMVGTSPTERPAARASRDQARSSPTTWITRISGVAGGISGQSEHRFRSLPRSRRQVIAFVVGRESAMLHILAIPLHRVANYRRDIRVLPHKLGVRSKGHVQNVVEDQNLPVAFRT